MIKDFSPQLSLVFGSSCCLGCTGGLWAGFRRTGVGLALLWCWFRDGHRLSGVIVSLRWALMLMVVPFGEQWSGLESPVLLTEWAVWGGSSVCFRRIL